MSKLSKIIKDLLPEQQEERRAFLFKVYSVLNPIYSKHLCILATTTKTGTHYLRLYLAHYISRLYKTTDKYDHTIIDSLFPNSWHSSYTFQKKRIRPMINTRNQGLSFSDMPRSHLPYQKAWGRRRIIHTFRNPLDQSVVSYFTKYNLEANPKYSSPYELLMETAENLVREYESFRSNSKVNVLRIPFERLMLTTQPLLEIIQFLGLPMNMNEVKNSAKFANEYELAKIGAFEKWQRPGQAERDIKKLHEFTTRLKELSHYHAIDAYKSFFTIKEQESAKILIRKLSPSMALYYNL